MRKPAARGAADSSAGAASFTLAGFRRGFWLAQPLAAGALIYGALFGVLAGQGGLSAIEAFLMSALVYSSSAQLAALQSWSASPLLAPLLVAIVMMNARYLLYGAALRPWLSSISPARAYGSLYFLGDGNWALSMKVHAEGCRDAGFVLGSGIAMFVTWVLGTIGGRALAAAIPDPAALGLDFMLIAFATAIAMSIWRGRGDLAPAAAAAVVAALLHRYAPGGWYIVGAGLAGAAVGAWRHAD